VLTVSAYSAYRRMLPQNSTRGPPPTGLAALAPRPRPP
jgi:hypothetical protein